MSTNRQGQRGEGKIGCIISLLVFLILGSVAYKIVPYWWAVDQLINTADELASRAGMLTKDSLMAQLKAKAKEQEIPEATTPGAITIMITGSGESGNCIITLRFNRNIDLFGITKVNWATDKRISKPWGKYS